LGIPPNGLSFHGKYLMSSHMFQGQKLDPIFPCRDDKILNISITYLNMSSGYVKIAIEKYGKC
jgi:hypothetical protein